MTVREQIGPHEPTKAGQSTGIIVEAPLVTFIGVSFEVPRAASLFEAQPKETWPFLATRILEMGAEAYDLARSSATVGLVDARIEAMTHQLQNDLERLLSEGRDELRDDLAEERVEAGKAFAEAKAKTSEELAKTLNDYSVKFASIIDTYFGQTSTKSVLTALPQVFDKAGQALLERVGKMLEGEETGVLAKQTAAITKEIRSGIEQVTAQLAARYALENRSAHAGRPYEDDVEDIVREMCRPMGHHVERTSNTVGLVPRSIAGDLVIHLNKNSLRGREATVVIEAKNHSDGTNSFSSNAIMGSLEKAQRNRGAAGGLFLSSIRDVLPLGTPFLELGATKIAMVYRRGTHEAALAVALRIVIANVVATLVPETEVDKEAIAIAVSDLRQQMTILDQVETCIGTAIKAHAKALERLSDLRNGLHSGLRRLDDAIGS